MSTDGGAADRRAVVVFACDPRIETARKPILGARSTGVHAAMLADTVERLRSTGADIVIAWRGEEERAWALRPHGLVGQRGKGFGARLAQAARDTCGLGYGRLAIVGIDCPALTAMDVRGALDRLADVDVVLGPARDGGIYLLGATEKALDRIDLAPLPWESGMLGDALREELSAAGLTSSELEPRDDIDSADALAEVLNALPQSRLTRLVQRALSPSLAVAVERRERTQLGMFKSSFVVRPPLDD